MALPTVIAKNQTGTPILLTSLGIEVPASPASITLTDFASYFEVVSDSVLENRVGLGDIVINDGTSDLSTADALNYLDATGNMNAPSSATDGALLKLDGTSGRYTISTGITVDGSDNITNAGTFNNVTVEGHAARHTDGSDDIQDATAAQKGLATAAQITKLDAIEALADVTDATSVAAAGAVMDSDFSEAEGFMRKTGAGAYEAIKSNLSASTSPGATDDSAAGYAVGSTWIDTTGDQAFVCLDATASSAVWTETTAGAAGGETNTASNQGTDGVGVFDVKSGVDLQFRHVAPASTKVTVALNGKDVDIDVDGGLILDGEFSGTVGFLHKTAAETYETLKSNLGASTAPGATDDSNASYAVGSRWIDTTADKEYVCLDATVSSAVWTETTATGGGSKAVVAWNPGAHGIYNSTACARTVRGTHAVWAFDDVTDEQIILHGYMPESYAAGNIDVSLQWAGDGVTTGDVVWNVEWERVDTGLDLDADSFATAQTATTTTSGTDGATVVTTITFTQAQADSVAAGERFRLRVTRDADNGSDTMAADAQVIGVWIEEV